jgi:hypothetical protein
MRAWAGRPAQEPGAQIRLSVQVTGCSLMPGQLSLSRSRARCHRGWGPTGKPGPAGGALMSGALAGSNTPAGGVSRGYGPTSTALWGGGKAADRMAAP